MKDSSITTIAQSELTDPVSLSHLRLSAAKSSPRRKQYLLWAVTAAWVAVLALLGPRLLSTLDAATGPVTWLSIVYFVAFTAIAWLYGIYNVAVVGFAMHYKKHWRPKDQPLPSDVGPRVALLYTTCNDFVEASAESCLRLSYQNYSVYILDDSSDPIYRSRVDAFALTHAEKVRVVRRPDRKGFKAGNLNHALGSVVTEPYFAIVDADEILPENFISALIPRLQADPHIGFIQANHRCVRDPSNLLKQDMHIGIDVHWRWYQPLRNRYGFVMFLGHGAVLRRSCWEEVGGFPEIVSEDLGYAIAIRERGYFGEFAEDVICQEEFPETVRDFRVRHVKWTRGTCEFLRDWTQRIVFSKQMSTAEKMDILFPTLNLPMTFFFFLFMINASMVLPLLMGETRILTIETWLGAVTTAVIVIPDAMNHLFTWDFFLVTVVCLVGPVLCFIVELWRRPLLLARFLANSTALYASLSPLSALCVLGFAVTGKARFLVTGDRGRREAVQVSGPSSVLQSVKKFFGETHPDSTAVQAYEIACAVTFAIAALAGIQVALLGLSIGFFLLPLFHNLGWHPGALRKVAKIPLLLIAAGIPLGGLGLLGIQPILFGFGFHF